MRILLWHSYLLGGTGSNVYTRQLAREWARCARAESPRGDSALADKQAPSWGAHRPSRRV